MVGQKKGLYRVIEIESQMEKLMQDEMEIGFYSIMWMWGFGFILLVTRKE